MAIISQSCSISRQGGVGRTIYLKKKMTAIIEEYFPLSKDVPFDYRAVFNDETEELIITKDDLWTQE